MSNSEDETSRFDAVYGAQGTIGANDDVGPDRYVPGTHWQRFGAIYIFLVLWLVLWAVHAWFGYRAAVHEAEALGQPFEWGDYLVEWLRDSFENLTSEAWQVLASAFIVERWLSKRRRFRASIEP